MSEMIKAGEFLPDISVKAIVKDEIKDIKLSLLFADHSLCILKIKGLYYSQFQAHLHQLAQQSICQDF